LKIEEVAERLGVVPVTVHRAVKCLLARGQITVDLLPAKKQGKPYKDIKESDIELISADFRRVKKYMKDKPKPVKLKKLKPKRPKPTATDFQLQQFRKFMNLIYLAKNIPDKPKDWLEIVMRKFNKGELK